MSTKLSAGRVRSTYEFIKAHRKRYSVQTMCRVIIMAPSGYYERRRQPVSNRAQEDARLLRLIRQLDNALGVALGTDASSHERLDVRRLPGGVLPPAPDCLMRACRRRSFDSGTHDEGIRTNG